MTNYDSFKRTVWKYYETHGRHELPWRKTTDPYKILVSEIMLQQTQVDRVTPKYEAFIARFPTAASLAKTDTKEVLLLWQGLGYNRRAINLKRAAEIVTTAYKGKFPGHLETLLTLPGIGKATAGDLLAFAWNEPAIVIETNIRTVFIHHFFRDQELVSDKELAALVEATLDKKNPREWYYALMDYGAYLKETRGNNISRSAHYKKQSKFKGSNRELRSQILKLLLEKKRTESELRKLLSREPEPIQKNLAALEEEGLIHREKNFYTA